MEQLELGLKITELRISKGITQKELADRCKVDIRTIQRIESGEVTPRMYTLNLLTEVLGCDLKTPVTSASDNSSSPIKALKLAFGAGLVYSVNAIPVVIDLTTHSFNQFARVLTFTIHSLSSILFFYGFYMLGKQCKNLTLTVSALLMIVLLPLTNLFYFIDAFAVALIYILLCINCVIFGAGVFLQGERSNFRSLYVIAGITGVIQSCLFLSFVSSVQSAGLAISVGCDLLLTAILFLEYQHRSNKIPFSGKEPILV